MNEGELFMCTTPSYTLETLKVGKMENFIYLIRDKATGRTAVVDPAWDVTAIMQVAKANDMHISDVLLTHCHYDHVNGLTELLQHYDAQIHISKIEAQFWGQNLNASARLHHGGDSFTLGKTQIDLWHTPGHTPGSACYHLSHDVIAGDTLFVFGCGRCDLAGGDPEQMFATLKHLAKHLEPTCVLRPGHDYAIQSTSTIAEQVAGNPFMHCQTVEQFRHYRMQLHDKIREEPYTAMSAEKVLQLFE